MTHNILLLPAGANNPFHSLSEKCLIPEHALKIEMPSSGLV